MKSPWPIRFLRLFCPPQLLEEIEGDLLQKFARDAIRFNAAKTKRKLLWNVIRYFRPGILLRHRYKNNLFYYSMLKNYFTIAFRSLWRAKAHTLINIFGLSLGITCCLLISLYVRDEVSFDSFHQKADRIYRVYAKEDWGENQQFFNTVTPMPMGPTLKSNLPEVEREVRVVAASAPMKLEGKTVTEQALVVGKDFFKVFDFKILRGDVTHALEGINNIVISEKAANKYFGDSDPVDKTISVQIKESFELFTVKAVTKNIPSNSSIQFDFLMSELNYDRLYGQKIQSAWFNILPETYVLLSENADEKNVETKFPPIFKTVLGEEDFKKSKYIVGLQPLKSIHLDADFPVGIAPVSNPKYSYILSGIAGLILILACINFITLSIGRSIKRAKEVGIRKVVGAFKNQLVTQFIGEAVLVTFISLIIGIGLSYFGLPAFNEISGKHLQFPTDLFMYVIVTVLLVIIGLIAGSYPAFVLSQFQPALILKGALIANSKQTLRKVLLGAQLTLSVFLISSTLLMRDQLNFVQNKNMGFDKEQLVIVPLNIPNAGRLNQRIKKGFEKAEIFKQELTKHAEIISTSCSSHDFGNGQWVSVGYTDEKNVYRNFQLNVIDDTYIPALKIKLAQGRNFSNSSPNDTARSIIINEAFAKEYGWDDPIGKRIPGKNFPDHEIVGVVKDFNFSSLYTKVQPLVLVANPLIVFKGIENVNIDSSPLPKLIVRLKAGQTQAGLEKIKTIWTQISGDEEFSFSFVDQALARQYESDRNLGRIVSIAALLAVLISSLGLYALATLTMQNRVKEISLRKIMGAPEKSLLALLVKEYIWLALVCLAISVPITWYMMSNWLSSFEYRVQITPMTFLLAGGISIITALATIGYQTVKTMTTNPVKNLKHE